MKMKNRLALILAVLMVLTFAVVTSGNAAEGEKIKLNYILLTEKDMVTETSVINDYNAQQDVYEVVPMYVEFDELDKQILLSATGGGDDLDIMMTNHSSVAQFVTAGVLEPLDDIAAAADLSTYQTAAVEIGQVDGIQYAIPYNPDCRVLVYNVQMVADTGFEGAPKTMDDLLTIAKGLQENGIYAFAGQYTKNWFPIYDFGCFMLGEGAHIYEVDAETSKFVASCQSEGMVNFMKWSKEMFQYMPKDYSIMDDMLREMMFQDQTCFMWFGPWEFKFFDEYLGQGKFALTTMPAGNVKSGSSMGGWMLGINANSKNIEGAKDFLTYVNQPEVMAKMAHALPANSESFDYPPFNEPKYEIFNEQFKTAEYPAVPNEVYALCADIFNTYYQKAVTGDLSIEDALAGAQADIQKELDRIQ